ncbi:MAG: methylaspartate ammonia-lyase [Spirochaetales bacterium]|nr:methylaspartate ammonia-lyase [Spirochaetales bacterium]
MRIRDVIFSPGKSGYYFDDQAAVKSGAGKDGLIYRGKPVTSGFSAIRQAGESVSIMLILEDGNIGIGDCTAVQYSGAGGRDPLFLSDQYIPFLEKYIKPLLLESDFTSFKSASEYFDSLLIKDKPLHTAIRYGISQAFLSARAAESSSLMCEVVCDEWNLPVIPERIPLFGQTGDDRYDGADKIILKRAEVLPHGLINNVDEKLGRDGEKLIDYIAWLVKRIKQLSGTAEYKPVLHLDVYGTIGILFDYKTEKIREYLIRLEDAAGGHDLYIEGPVDVGEKTHQIESLGKIKESLEVAGSRVKIVADEWCNTFKDIKDFTDADCCHMVQIKTPDLGCVNNIVESVLYCNRMGMESYQGGTCNETDISARACVHLGLATRPQRMLVKPGMGFDEGFTIVNNEMSRTIDILKMKQRSGM